MARDDFPITWNLLRAISFALEEIYENLRTLVFFSSIFLKKEASK